MWVGLVALAGLIGIDVGEASTKDAQARVAIYACAAYSCADDVYMYCIALAYLAHAIFYCENAQRLVLRLTLFPQG